MPKSMTGYGSARDKILGRSFVVEAKSVNHKYCEINLKISSRLSQLESKISAFAKEFFSRGRIDLFIKEEVSEASPAAYQLDSHKLKLYYQQLKKIHQELGQKEIPIAMEALLSLPQVIVPVEDFDEEKVWKKLKPLVKKAFESLDNMRKKEGKALEKFLLDELKSLNQRIKKVQKLIPKKLMAYKIQMEKRLKNLLPIEGVDPSRLAAEVALFVDRTDVSEEVSRFISHISHFKDLLKKQGPSGRKLDFLLQEMNREANTLSAKSQSALISQEVVECKHSLERMREQVQNLE